MNWTTPNDIKERLMRLWKAGDLLRSVVTGEPAFPLQVKLKGPTPAELPKSFEAARSWIKKLLDFRHVELEWREVNNRIVSSQNLPSVVRIETVEDAATIVGRREHVETFKQMLAYTREHLPTLI